MLFHIIVVFDMIKWLFVFNYYSVIGAIFFLWSSARLTQMRLWEFPLPLSSHRNFSIILMLAITPNLFCTSTDLFTNLVMIALIISMLRSTHPSDGLNLFSCDCHRCYSSLSNSNMGRLIPFNSCWYQQGYLLL